MATQTKHNNRFPLFVDKQDETHIAALLRDLTPDPKTADLGLATWTLYQQRNGTRAPAVLTCHNAQAAAGRWPILEFLAGRARHALVPLPDPGAPLEPGLLMLEAEGAFGDLARDLRGALDPSGPGGVTVTVEELRACMRDGLAGIALLHQVIRAMEARKAG